MKLSRNKIIALIAIIIGGTGVAFSESTPSPDNAIVSLNGEAVATPAVQTPTEVPAKPVEALAQPAAQKTAQENIPPENSEQKKPAENAAPAPASGEKTPQEKTARDSSAPPAMPEKLPGSTENIFDEPQLPAELDFKNLLFSGSMMFDKKSLEMLYQAVEGADVKMETAEAEIKTEQLVAPAFYLSSMIYVDKTSWFVWVNGKKYSESTFEKLYIDNINDDRVAFIWQSTNLDAISPNWQSKFEYVEAENNKFTGQAGYLSKDRNIFVDKTGQVFFKLAVNQSFVSHTMEIAEGLVADTVINNETEVKP